MFEPIVEIIPEPDGEFSLLVRTQVPNGRFRAGGVSKRKPSDVQLGAHAVPIQLKVRYQASAELAGPRTLIHRAFDVKLAEGTVLTAFVTLPGGEILGTTETVVTGSGVAGELAAASLTLGTKDAVRPPLTPALCQATVVAAAPSPGSFTGPAQQLRQLGVVDDPRATFHRIGIGQRMNGFGYQVDLTKVNSGPAVTVAACRDSVFANAR
jgi:hypothetical protein